MSIPPPHQALLAVEVAYATPGRQMIVEIHVPVGTTVAQAIEISALREHFPEMETRPPAGIFGVKVEPDQVLSTGDRIEIYRPLIADPKEARRRKAEKQRAARQTPRRPA